MFSESITAIKETTETFYRLNYTLKVIKRKENAFSIKNGKNLPEVPYIMNVCYYTYKISQRYVADG
jgi:hypothetical protein